MSPQRVALNLLVIFLLFVSAINASSIKTTQCPAFRLSSILSSHSAKSNLPVESGKWVPFNYILHIQSLSYYLHINWEIEFEKDTALNHQRQAARKRSSVVRKCLPASSQQRQPGLQNQTNHSAASTSIKIMSENEF